MTCFSFLFVSVKILAILSVLSLTINFIMVMQLISLFVWNLECGVVLFLLLI